MNREETGFKELKREQEKEEMNRQIFNRVNRIYEMMVNKQHDEDVKFKENKIKEIEEQIKRSQQEIMYLYQDIIYINEHRREELSRY